MSRYHYWQFLVNQEGQPINNAQISVYRAGSNTPAYVYRSELGDDVTNETPQVYTNNIGYFEFWLGDTEELEGYPIGQKFKLQGEREGIASGSIDGIDIFPGFAPVNEDDQDSTIKNKLVSNYLVNKGDTHVDHDVTEDSFPIHGLERINVDSEDTTYNKVLNNSLAKDGNDHSKNSNDHQDINVYAFGILSGGGTITENVTISLNNSDITHNNVSDIQGGDVGERYHLSESNHSNLTGGTPEFDRVILDQDPVLPDHAVRKDYVDDIAQGMFWQNSVIDFHDPEADGFPVDPENSDRYISESHYYEGDNEGYENYIYEFDSEQGDGIEIEPKQGYTLLVEEEIRHYHYNGSEGIKFWAGFAGYEISSDTTLTDRCGYLVDCSSDEITLTFPENPKLGSRIDILDYTSSSEDNNIILHPDGSKVEGQDEFIVDINGAGLQFVYTGDENVGWKMINEVYSEEALTKIMEEYHEFADDDDAGIENTDTNEWYLEISHERDKDGPTVTIFETDDRVLLEPNQIKSIDSETIKVVFDDKQNITVKIS